jgi:hypothetical protein
MPYTPAETVQIRARGRFVPWTVPAWLPREVEGPLTFLVGAFGGVLLAFWVVTVTNAFLAMGGAAPAAEPVSRVAAIVEPGARVLVIAKPLAFAERAPVAAESDVAPVVPRAASRPVATRAPARKTATVRPTPKRDVFAAALNP